MLGIIYGYVRWSAKIVLPLFFRPLRVEGSEHIPTDRGALVVSNHQGAFLDAIILGALLPHRTYYMTRADVFTPVFDWILRTLHMLPVYRIRNGFSQLKKNDETFDQARELLKNRSKLVIFPEANHGREHYLRSTSKGTARLALQTCDEMNEELYVLPCGINYFDHVRSRRPLVVSFGEPILVNDYLAGYHDHKAKGINVLKAAIADSIKQQMMIPDGRPDYEAVRSYLQTVDSTTGLDDAKRIISNYKPVGEKAPRGLSIAARLARLSLLPFFYLMDMLIAKINDRLYDQSVKVAFAMLVFPWLCGVVALAVGLLAGAVWALMTVVMMVALVFFA